MNSSGIPSTCVVTQDPETSFVTKILIQTFMVPSGERLQELVDWLGNGGIEREANLLRTLSSVTLGPILEPGTIGAVAAPPAAGAAASEAAGPSAAAATAPSMDLTVLQFRRPNGYAGLVAPMLRGEGNWPKIGLFSSYEARTLYCVDSMLSAIPTWTKVGAPPPLRTRVEEPSGLKHCLGGFARLVPAWVVVWSRFGSLIIKAH